MFILVSILLCSLVLLGLAAWDSFKFKESVSETNPWSRPHRWTCSAILTELWRLHRPAIVRWLPEYNIRKYLVGDVVSGELFEFNNALVLRMVVTCSIINIFTNRPYNRNCVDSPRPCVCYSCWSTPCFWAIYRISCSRLRHIRIIVASCHWSDVYSGV